MSLPPDLRVLCRRLTSTPPAQLPHSIPAFTGHVLRCRDVLSTPHDPKAKDGANEAYMLVHKLKTIITTLLNGKSAAGRFTGVTLVKAVVDVGGWECLRESGPWVRSLLSILQKHDPCAVKELCVVALIKIYTLVNGFQTLTREIATPTIATFFNACLQLVKQPPAGERLKTPLHLVETILDAFATLQPLYPATCRPFNKDIRVVIKPYLAPTSSDDILVPESLQRASRRVAISIHFTTAGKSGPSDEWAKFAAELPKDFHLCADQVFRAVQESWDTVPPRARSTVNYDAPPQGEDSGIQLPAWKGVRAGGDRLIGLFRLMADSLRYPTKDFGVIPVGAFLDTVSRVSLISRRGKTQTWEQALETHPAVGREEKEELWSIMANIHIAALELLQTLFRRLQHNALPLASESLDIVVLILKSGIDNPVVRVAAYKILSDMLPIVGPSMSKPATDAVGVVMLACCRDLQQEAGHLAAPAPSSKPESGAKKNSIAANADLFLPQQQGDAALTPANTTSLPKEQLEVAETLLASLLANIPQRRLKPGLRGLLDQTAVLSQSRDAMLASVLNPYINEAGKSYASILPHLSRRFPRDQGVEILRSNIRSPAPSSGDGVDMTAGFEELDEVEDDEDDDEMVDAIEVQGSGEDQKADEVEGSSGFGIASKTAPVLSGEGKDLASNNSPFLTQKPSTVEAASGSLASQKRKLEDAVDVVPPHKKHGVEKSIPERPVAAAAEKKAAEGEGESDDESVDLNMDLDDLDDEEDEE
ncbi:hypothetical protein BN1708_014093 [Verticillium longisporum]|uniref:Pre-rRNA-processing protein RIX1 n=1 Tax=Verticillium longisporum TaxID=100787 RepID=A0A0G4LTQ9_VERLO|nr:Pre-rRNA-processing protein rix1 like [Verticillium longisporum]CRK24990.1 hypothetical protein BN1708_014093 [Verticillium longisporum]